MPDNSSSQPSGYPPIGDHNQPQRQRQQQGFGPQHVQHGTGLHDDESVDSSAQLWDQLNDEEARMIQQHQSRFHTHGPDARSNTLNIVYSMTMGTISHIQQQLHVLARDFQRRREREERAVDSYYQGGTAAARSRRRRQGAIPPPLEAFDLHFGIEENDDIENHGTINSLSSSSAAAATNAIDRDNAKPLKSYPFVLLRDREVPNRQAITNPQDTWGIVGNLDVFLQHLYHYYYNRGLVPMTCKFLVETFSLLFTLWLSRILLTRVDWRELTTCKDETSCKTNWSDYYYSTGKTNALYWIVQGYTLLILAYTAFSTYLFWNNFQHAVNCRHILIDKLGLSLSKLSNGALGWDTVVQALADHQQSGLFRTTLGENALDPLSIAQRILRKDNYLVAFWNQGLMDKCKIGNRYYWSSTIEWCIHNCVLNFIFNHKYEIRPAFVLDAASLRRRMQVCAVGHLFLLPFLVLFVTVHFFLRNVYDFKTSKRYLGNHEWSRVSLHQFREFNELQHSFDQRLEPSYEAASQYLRLFGTSELIAATGKLLQVISGAIGGVILLLGLLNDAILLHVQLWGRNLLWYAGIAGLSYSVGQSLLPSKEATPSASRNLFEEMDLALKNVAAHTHYYPSDWKGRGWDSNVHKSFKNTFETKLKLFMWELASLILAPYILYFRLSSNAAAICEFVLLSKARIKGVGDVCGFSTFDFDLFKDQAWDGRTMGESTVASHTPINGRNSVEDWPQESLEQSILRTGNLDEASKLHPKPRAREGKMEKSFFTFRVAHPTFKCSPSGQKLMDCVDEYRATWMSQERELHIKAATRQLETLALLERQQAAPQSTHFRFGSSSSVSTPQDGGVINGIPPADAGAGSNPREFVTRASLSHIEGYSSNWNSSPQSQLQPTSTSYQEDLPVGAQHDRLSPLAPLSSDNEVLESNADRQFLWLEKFHEHLKNEQEAQTQPVSKQ